VATETTPDAVDSVALRLLACGAAALAIICLLILPGGPQESDETWSWVLAFVLAVPFGFLLAARQERALSEAAPAAASRGVAAGITILALAFIVRRASSGDRLDHAILLLGSLAALAAPLAAARIWRDPADADTLPGRIVAAVWLGGLALIFVPGHALRLSNLVPALLLTAALLAAMRFLSGWRLRGWAGHAADAALCLLLFLAVAQLPNLTPYIDTVVYHQGFFLGPVNDVLHGRAMLGGAWSQYGIGLIDALALLFTAIPIGFGTMTLIVVVATGVQYVCSYAILRLAGLGLAMTAITLVVAAAGNLFSPLLAYLLYPSAGPIRFGMPYLIVLAAVIGARCPARARPARIAVLALLGLGAVWSFETFTYCAVTYGCLVLIDAVADGTAIIRRVARGAAVGIGVCVVSLALFSLVTLALDSRLEWGPYFEYLKLYTTGELGALPVVVFSAGPLMAAAVFFTGVALLWVVHRSPGALEPPIRTALAGFTGLAMGMFTYYLGRSHPNNLLVILVPVILLTGLWAQVLVSGRPNRWRGVALAVLALGWSMIAVASWPSVKEKWQTTALALAVPGSGGSLRDQIDEYTGNPAFNPLAELGVEMLERHFPPGAPALVLTQQDLTTEILVRSDRRNLLPISHPPEDTIVESSFDRVRASAASIPAGTLMLTSPVPNPPGQVAPVTGLPVDYNALQLAALEVLQSRFDFERIEGSPQTLEIVRLVPKAGV
jgi:hypothetical protein